MTENFIYPQAESPKNIKDLLNLQTPESHLLAELLTQATGVDISQIELDSFLNQLNQARQADSINTFTQSFGHIGVYCEGGIYRSRQMGNLLNSLGFVFADPACIRGETISNLLNKLMVDSEVKIGRLRLDTVLLLLSGETEEQLASISPLIQRCNTGKLEKPLSLVLIETEDITFERNIVKDKIATYFPDITPPIEFNKPW